MGQTFGVLFDSNAVRSADVLKASSSIEVFTLRLAESLGRHAAVSIASPLVSMREQGPGFVVIPKTELRTESEFSSGIVIRLGYDPKSVLQSARLARTLGWELGVFVFDHHHTAVSSLPGYKRSILSIWFWLGFRLLKKADRLFVVNPQSVHYFPHSLQNKVVHTAVGVELRPVVPSSQRCKGLVVFAGSLTDENMVSELIDGFALARVDGSKLEIYGDGPSVDRVVESSARVSNCSYLGRQSQEVVAEAQQRAWVNVSLRKYSKPSSDFAFPSKLVECLASGAVTVTSAIPSLPDLEQISLVVADESTEAIAAAIQRALSMDWASHSDMAGDARKLMAKQFDWGIVAANLAADFPME